MLSTIPLISGTLIVRDVQNVLLVLAIDETTALRIGIVFGLHAVHSEHPPIVMVESPFAGLVLRHVVDQLST